MAVSLCEENSPTYFAHCGQVVLAARAANLCPIAGVCDKIDDHVQIEKFYRKMKACGFTGAVTVTPTQIDQANFEFSPSLKEMKWSRSVLAQDGLFTIQPSVQESRQMIGPPHREIAMAISRQHECIQNISVPSSHKPAFLTAQTRSHGVIFASGNHCHGAVESHVGELIFDDQSPGHERWICAPARSRVQTSSTWPCQYLGSCYERQLLQWEREGALGMLWRCAAWDCLPRRHTEVQVSRWQCATTFYSKRNTLHHRGLNPLPGEPT